jgi:hypothetical protein
VTVAEASLLAATGLTPSAPKEFGSSSPSQQDQDKALNTRVLSYGNGAETHQDVRAEAGSVKGAAYCRGSCLIRRGEASV